MRHKKKFLIIGLLILIVLQYFTISAKAVDASSVCSIDDNCQEGEICAEGQCTDIINNIRTILSNEKLDRFEKISSITPLFADYFKKLPGPVVPEPEPQCGSDQECPLNYICENSKCVPLPVVPGGEPAPEVFNTKFYQSPVRADPDDLLLISGHEFEGGAIAVYKAVSDKPVNLQPPTIVPNTNTVNEGKLFATAENQDSITVLLPEEMKSKQTYALWVKNPNSGWSEPILINDPRPLWVTPNKAYSTQSFASLPREIKVVGRNLENAIPPAPAQLRLVGPETYILPVMDDNDPSTAIEHYAAKAVLPNAIQLGVYDVEFSRDGTNWIDLPQDATFTVLPDPQQKQQFDISTYGCSSDDGLDDTGCILDAIADAEAAGGGEVFFPAGMWELKPDQSIIGNGVDSAYGIIVPQGVDFVGAGREVTSIMQTLQWVSGSNDIKVVFTLQGNNIVHDIHFTSQGRNGPLSGAYVYMALGKSVIHLSPSEQEIKDIQIYDSKFTDMPFTAAQISGVPAKNIFIVGNEFQPFAFSLRFLGNRNVKDVKFKVEDSVVAGNTFFPGGYSVESQGTLATGIGGTQRLDFSNNVADGSVNGGWRAGFFWNSLGNNEQVLIYGNTATCTGDKTGDGEAIVFDDNGNVAGSSYPQEVVSATANTVSVTGAWTESTPDFYDEHWAFVVDGKGVGQARKIIDYTTASPYLITVSPGWDVIPDTSSSIGVARSLWNGYVVDNTVDIRGCLKNQPRVDQSGIVGWAATTTDSAIEGNELYETNGILVNTGVRKDNHFIVYSSEIRNNLVDGEYKYPESIGGINLWTGISPDYFNSKLENKNAIHNLLVSHNTVKDATTSGTTPGLHPTSGIGFIPRTLYNFDDNIWWIYNMKGVSLFHNTINNAPIGSYVLGSGTALYKNNFVNIKSGREVIDDGYNSVYCGNGKVELNEACDEGLLEECPYGQTSCQVCSAQCDGLVSGKTSYCGDNVCDYRYESSASCQQDCGSVCPTDDIVGWWPAEGNAEDIILHNDGEVMGDVTFAAGVVGQAFTFEGDGGLVSVPDFLDGDFDFGTDDFTISFWARSNEGKRYVIGTGCPSCAGGIGYNIDMSTNNDKVVFRIDGEPDGGDSVISILSPGADLTQWHHYASVFDRDGLLSMYFDGSLAGTSDITPQAGSVSNPWPLNFGALGAKMPYKEFVNNFDGAIDEISIWRKALTPSEIQSIYNSAGNGMCS